MPRDQRLELADQLGVASERQVGVDSLVEHGEPHLREAGDLRLGKPLVGEVSERGTAPQRERLPQLGRRARWSGAAGLGRELLEPRHVELIGLDVEHVATGMRGEASRVEQLPQPGDIDLDVLPCPRRWRASPDLIDELVARDQLVRVHQEEREHGALLGSPELQRPVVVDHLERAKEPEVHGRRPKGCRAGRTRRRRRSPRSAS
jgi:hypothetical protein